MFIIPENNVVNLDLAVLKKLSPGNTCSLFWDDDISFTLEKEFVIGLFLSNKIDFAPGHLRKLRYFPSKEITFIKENGCPGWFRMYSPQEAEAM